MSNIIKQDGYSYSFNPQACESCGGRCCTGESGNIFVNQNEIKSIVNILNIDTDEFYTKYLKKVDYKYSLKEKKYLDSYDCIFFDRATNGCAIYEARPTQCRTFPFWPYFKTHIDELLDECQGIINE